MIPATTIDPSRRLDFPFRLRRAGSKKFIFLNSDGTALDISSFDFVLNIKEYPGARTNIIQLTIGSGLTVGGAGNNELTASLTVANTSVQEQEYYWELYKGSTSKTYLNGLAPAHNGVFDGVSNDQDTLTVTDGSSEVTITISDTPSDEIPLVDFNTALTFDYDKDLSTVSGGTRTFTLASSGHLNGVGIVARVNDPVAINFPVGFELVSGSDTVSVTDMNIIVFRYFSDYDGAGNDKVLYSIKNQTSI